MQERIEQELALLRQHFSNLEYREEGRWVLLPNYPVPPGIWDRERADICFQIPPGYPGQKPYGFYVRPRIGLLSGAAVQNRTDSTEPPFGGEWAKFSWDVPDWRATADLQAGANLLNYVWTFEDRLRQGA